MYINSLIKYFGYYFLIISEDKNVSGVIKFFIYMTVAICKQATQWQRDNLSYFYIDFLK